jgi:type I restriction enzyme, S subunit
VTIRIEGSRQFPKGWAITSIRELAYLVTKGSTPTTYGFNYEEKGINFVKVENIEHGRISKKTIKQFITNEAYAYFLRSQLANNDVLFSIAGTIGRTGIVQKEDLPANTNQAVAIIRCPWQFVNPYFLKTFLESTAIKQAISKKNRGVGMNNIGLEDVKNIQIPFPPLLEQGRIVAKIEELFSFLDAGTESLRKVQAQLKRYRQAVLKYAFEGKLTEEWRKTHNDKIEPVCKLMDTIRDNRSVSQKKKIPILVTENLPNLPDTWQWIRLGDVADLIQYGTSEKTNLDKNGIPVLRMGNIQDGKLDFQNLKYLPKETPNLPDYFLEAGDVLFNRTNSAELVGKTAVYQKNHPASAFASYLIRARMTKESCDPTILSYYINSHFGRNYINSVVSQQVGQANVNGTKLSMMPIPLIPWQEQQKLRNEMERLISIIIETEQAVFQEVKQAELLRQSLLKEAFSGGLVPQDPTDEPAEKLLHRIKNEHSGNKSKVDS